MIDLHVQGNTAAHPVKDYLEIFPRHVTVALVPSESTYLFQAEETITGLSASLRGSWRRSEDVRDFIGSSSASIGRTSPA